jgi:hypothetical protein
MLTSSRNSIGDFSSPAGDVRLQIAVTRAMGEPIGPVTAVEQQGLSTIRELINLGSRFHHDPEGNLDVTGSTPEQIDLVVELERMLPGELESIRGDEGVDIRKWSEAADGVLKRFEEATSWRRFEPAEREFIDRELEPFLVRLLNVPDEDDEE